MPQVQVPASDLRYDLVSFDAQGRERADDPDGLMSRRVLETLNQEPVTDVFSVSGPVVVQRKTAAFVPSATVIAKISSVSRRRRSDEPSIIRCMAA